MGEKGLDSEGQNVGGEGDKKKRESVIQKKEKKESREGLGIGRRVEDGETSNEKKKDLW